MENWFDWKLFGNGHGMASPFFDDVFYWLVDTSSGVRDSRNGEFYRAFGGLGAQLESIEWRMPRPGTRRRLFGHEFVVYSVTRKFPKVRVSWALTPCVKDFEEVRQLHEELRNWGHGI
jgi:hypothetical protein